MCIYTDQENLMWAYIEDSKIDYKRVELQTDFDYCSLHLEMIAWRSMGLNLTYITSTEEYFKKLERKLEFVEGVYTPLECQLEYYEYVTGENVLSWEEEYILFCEEQEDLEYNEVSKDYHLPWFNLEKDIETKQNIYKRKKKHVKDDTRLVWNKTYPPTRSTCTRECCMDNRLHKHKRSSKIFTEEESEYGFLASEESYYEAIIFEELLWEESLENFLEYEGECYDESWYDY